MSSIVVEERSRVANTSQWGAWVASTANAPFNNSDIKEYRVVTSGADIVWEDVVGSGTVEDGGHVGDLLKIARAHVDEAVRQNRLTQKDAGQVYTAMIPAALQSALKFVMDEKLLESQIDKSTADAESAKTKALTEEALQIATIKKVYGYDFTLDSTGKLDVTSLTSNGEGKMDYDNAQVKEQTLLVKEQINNAKGEIPTKLLGTQLNAWTSVFNGGKIDNVAKAVDNAEIETALTKVQSLIP